MKTKKTLYSIITQIYLSDFWNSPIAYIKEKWQRNKNNIEKENVIVNEIQVPKIKSKKAIKRKKQAQKRKYRKINTKQEEINHKLKLKKMGKKTRRKKKKITNNVKQVKTQTNTAVMKQKIEQTSNKTFQRKTNIYNPIIKQQFRNGNPQFIRNEHSCNKQKAITELKQLKQELYRYFCINDYDKKSFYLNGCYDRSIEYQQAIDIPQLTTTKLLPGYMEPYMEALKKEVETQGLSLNYSFPLNGEIGFIHVKNKTR